MERKGILDRLIEEDARIIEDGERTLQDLWRKAQARAKTEAAEDSQDESEKIRTLEVMPEDVKVLYVRILVAHCFVDGELNPIKVADIYLFMSKIRLSPDSREQIRRSLAAGESQPPGVVDLAKEVVSKVPPEERDVVAFSIVKDLTWISRTDGIVLPSAKASIRAVAKAFGKDTGKVMKLADKIIEHEEAMIKDDMTASELEKGMKDIVAVAAATSVPVTALFFSGSVVGLSAAGITSGLAALGLGGVLGLSAMVTGIGAVVVLGVRLGAERASQMYYRLLLIASNDEVRSGRYVGESLSIRRINVGEKLSEELLKVPARRRPLKVASLLEDLLDDAEGDGVLLNRLEILFEESLKVEPLTLLGRHALGRTLADVLRCPPTPRADLSSVRARP